MDLLLWRHAEAFDAEGHDDDLERALTPKGERQAQRMADWINRHLPAGAKVLASPARRTQQTAAALDRKVKTLSALAPGAGVDALLQATRWPDGRDSVLVVGHQPTLGLAAAYLLTGQPLAWPLRKGGLIWLRGRTRDEQPQVLLHAALAPELV